MRKPSRNPNGAGSIYRGTDGYFHARVTMGIDPITGKPVRRHISRRTKKEAWEAMEDLREQAKRGAGTAVAPKRQTVGTWINEWLSAIVVGIRPRTWMTYESLMRNHVVPAIGHIPLDRLTVTDINLTIVAVAESSSPMVADNMRRTLRVALGAAVGRGLLVVNPVSRSVKPKVATHTPPPLSNDQVRRFVKLLIADPYRARWLVAIFCGLRQGESLGLFWSDIDWTEGTVSINRQVQRLLWKHGCSADKRCGKRPASCPDRKDGGLRLTPPKTPESIRVNVPPKIVMLALAAHRQQQMRDRLAAKQWDMPDLVFTNNHGGMVDPKQDYKRGKVLFKAIGAPKTRIHTLRHTAVTAMLEAGLSSPLIAATLGWSPSTTAAMLGRYGHVRIEHQRAAADILEASLMGEPAPVSEVSGED